MSLKYIIRLTTFGSLALLVLAACNNNNAPVSGVSKAVEICAETDVRARCILETAETTLSSIEDGFDWTTSAAELAIAYDSQGETERAWALLGNATERLQAIEDAKKRATALGDIALALPKLKTDPKGKVLIVRLEALASAIESDGKRADVTGKIFTTRAVHGDIQTALSQALQMSQESEIEDTYKGRTLRELAVQFAKRGDFDIATSTIAQINSSFTYYGAVARTDVVAIAIAAGQTDIVNALLDQAESIAQAQDNEYFMASILRDIGYNLVTLGETKRGLIFFEAARESARNAKSMQEKARSMSRIATRLADCGDSQKAQEVIAEAVGLAQQVESEVMQNYSNYEISGSAAFSGDFTTAKALIRNLPDTAFGSATSLKSASERDLAWGLARNDQLVEGLKVANAITSKREKIHAMSRLVRLIGDPKMKALPRYL